MFLRLPAAALLVCALAACEVSSSGAVVLNGQPAKMEITQVDNGLLIVGYDVVMNGENLGRTKRLPNQKIDPFKKKTIRYEPLQSRYGEVNLVQNLDFGTNSFDVYIAGKYSGTVQLPVG